MHMKITKIILIGFLLVACLCGCGQKSALEGKVIDGKAQPLAGVRVVAKQVKSDNGQFEITTGADGVFKFEKLAAASEYELIPYLDANTKSRSIMAESAPAKQTKKLPQPLPILFIPSPDGLLVRDTTSGLLWLRDAGKVGKMNWDAAMAKAKQFNYAGFSDWRLPTKVELRTLAAYGGQIPAETLNKETFTNVQAAGYWTSDINDANKAFAWAVNMADGKMVNDNKIDFSYHVWMVRAGK